MTVLCVALGDPTPKISLFVGGVEIKSDTTRQMVTTIQNVTTQMDDVTCYAGTFSFYTTIDSQRTGIGLKTKNRSANALNHSSAKRRQSNEWKYLKSHFHPSFRFFLLSLARARFSRGADNGFGVPMQLSKKIQIRCKLMAVILSFRAKHWKFTQRFQMGIKLCNLFRTSTLVLTSCSSSISYFFGNETHRGCLLPTKWWRTINTRANDGYRNT